MKKFKFTINGNDYETEIRNIEDNIAEVDVNGTVYSVEIKQEIKTPKTPKLVRTQAVPSADYDTKKTNNPSDAKGVGNIKAPLPGTILEIFVKVGDRVKVGDKLIVMEAMKMENNINSDKEGIVSAIKIQKGDTILEGTVLIEIGS